VNFGERCKAEVRGTTLPRTRVKSLPSKLQNSPPEKKPKPDGRSPNNIAFLGAVQALDLDHFLPPDVRKKRHAC
jgi:hypothetical protein